MTRVGPVERTSRRTLLGLVLLVGPVACGSESQPPEVGEDGVVQSTDSTRFEGRVYERSVVFAAVDGDSIFLVPWMMRAEETTDSVEREARAWLSRGGVWDRFYDEHWATPPEQGPDLLLPHAGLSLLVRDGGAIDGIVFEEGRRSLEIILESVGASWTDAGGGSFEILTGSAYLAAQRIEGMVLNVARASLGGRTASGDWAFLLSGDSAQFVLATDEEHGAETEAVYRGWGDLGEEERGWPEVRVEWRRTEAFPPARRDVPVEWRLTSDDGSVEGELEAVSADIRAGEGPGPLLPVHALLEVEGEVRSGGLTFPVHGVLVHERR